MKQLDEWRQHIVKMYVDERMPIQRIADDVSKRSGLPVSALWVSTFVKKLGIYKANRLRRAVEPRQRTCKHCQQQFVGHHNQMWCSVCVPREFDTRAVMRMRHHGLTQIAYESLLARQENKCGVCGNELGIDQVIDHDHDTGHVRGVVCRTCNLGLAYIDRSGWVEKARDYVQRTLLK